MIQRSISLLVLGFWVATDSAVGQPVGRDPVPGFWAVDSMPPSSTFGVMAANLARRFNPRTGAQVTSAQIVHDGFKAVRGPNDPALAIDGDQSPRLSYEAKAPGDPDPILTVTVDLGAISRIGRIQHWWDQQAYPATIEVRASTDGKTFRTLSGPHPGKQNDRTDFAPAEARYVRLIGRGAGASGRVNLGEVLIHPAWDAVPTTTSDGLDLADLPGAIWSREAGPDTAAWASFSLGNAQRTTRVAQGKAGASNPAVATLDLGAPRRVGRIQMIFDGLHTPTWEHGGKIEVRADASSRWETVLDQGSPLGTTAIDWSAGPKVVRQVRVTNRHAPGKGTGTGRLWAVECFGMDAPIALRPIASPTAPEAGTLSAAVFDERGATVRTLLRAQPVEAGPVAIYWDGRDDRGELVPAGSACRLVWAFGRAKAEVVTAVGNSGVPARGDRPAYVADEITASGGVSGVAADPAGNVYLCSVFEEESIEVRSLGPAGATRWAVNDVGLVAIATDGVHVFTATSTTGAAIVRRRRASDGTFAPWVGGRSDDPASARFLIPTNAAVRRTQGRLPDDRELRDQAGVVGLAVETGGDALFACNHARNRVEVWSKSTGRPIRADALRVEAPVGIAVDPRGGSIWVASGRETVARYRYDRSFVVDPKPLAVIRGLADPCGLAVVDLGGSASPDIRLAVAERGRNRIRQYVVNDRPIARGPFADFGRDYAPGPLAPDKFSWTLPDQRPAIAATPDGALVVSDPENRRVVALQPDGSTAWIMHREYVPSASVDRTRPLGPIHRVLAGSIEYEVAVDGHRLPDGLGDGAWRPVANWRPADGRFMTTSFFSPSWMRRLDVHEGTGKPPRFKEFLFHLENGLEAGMRGIAIYAVEDGTLRRAAIVGNRWSGPDDDLMPPENRRWIWTDANGDGKVAFQSPTSPTDEVLEFETGQPWGDGQLGGALVDEEGAIWAPLAGPLGPKNEFDHAVCKIPIIGWEQVGGRDQYNPIYSFRRIVPVKLAGSMFDHRGRPQVAYNLRPSGDGGVFLQTRTPEDGDHPDRAIRRLAPRSDGSFKQIMERPLLSEASANFLAADPDPKKGRFVETGSGGSMHWLYVRDPFGLALAFATAEGTPYDSNWNDNNAGVDAFSLDGRWFVYVEDVYGGKLNLYRIDGLDDVAYGRLDFNWPGPAAWTSAGAP